MPMKNPPHPGAGLRDDIEALGLTVAETAAGLGVTRQQLYNITSGKSAITPEMALRLELVARDGVGQLLRRHRLEVHGLARVGADARRDEEHPGQQLALGLRRIGGQELAGLLGQIHQDGAAVEHHGIAVDDGGHL